MNEYAYWRKWGIKILNMNTDEESFLLMIKDGLNNIDFKSRKDKQQVKKIIKKLKKGWK